MRPTKGKSRLTGDAREHGGELGGRARSTCGHAVENRLPPYLTVAEAADLARVSDKRLRNLMADRTLKEGVHFTRPHGLRPRFKAAALVAWMEGTDKPEQPVVKATVRGRCKVDLSLIPSLHTAPHGV